MHSRPPTEFTSKSHIRPSVRAVSYQFHPFTNTSAMVRVLDDMDYSEEVPHSEHLVVRGTEPFNAEPTAAALVEFPITPEELVYCRNHGPVLDIDESTWSIQVNSSKGSHSFTLEELRNNFLRVEVVAALQVRLILHNTLVYRQHLLARSVLETGGRRWMR